MFRVLLGYFLKVLCRFMVEILRHQFAAKGANTG